ncbi:hypothetical protein L6164_015501 [Bauhinia variegata]|uniref:Uncharacterized protein n=1 Tax=Bauhinia variegata TaxID=167791 RepID=A0ACB9NKU7_BAUVA|nr:hypothetical protein L6164_015501 [Bauhinia variegata]
MEPIGAFPDGEWDCFGRMFATGELDCLPQFLAHTSFLLGEDDGLNIGKEPTFCSISEAGENESMLYSLEALNSSLQYSHQENSYRSDCSTGDVFIANPGLANCYFSDSDHVPANNACVSMITSFFPSRTDIALVETLSPNENGRTERLENPDYREAEPTVIPVKQLRLKRRLDVPEQDFPGEDKRNANSSENQKIKPRISRDVQRCKKNARPKKNQKLTQDGNEEEEINAGSDGQSSSSYSSEDVDASQENSGGTSSTSKSTVALNLNGKTRASRGSATDPQSLYARKRRERINERLRILQNLVPNGTKVDISTMLEEAVHYVKFMQLQIKLLSSDDLWMYAPIAYNGIDILLNRKISPPL